MVFSESSIRWICCLYTPTSLSNWASASARPGACWRITAELMYPIFVGDAAVGACAPAIPANISDVVSATDPARISARIYITPVLEELSEFEVELPAGCRAPLCINFVEPIPDVYAQRSQWADGADAKAKAPEEAGWIELARLIPVVSAFEEAVQIERLIHSQSELAGANEERVAERPPLCLSIAGRRVVAAWRDGKFVVSAQRLAILGAADREGLGIEERTGVAEDGAGARG